MPELKDLLQVYSHIQRDIESVKQRQWRDFHGTLLGQGGLLFLWDRLAQSNPELFISLSALLWAAGTWFLVENREVLKVYRSMKDACAKSLKEVDVELYKVLDPPHQPIIVGKLHHPLYSTALFLATFLVIVIIFKCSLPSQCVFTIFFLMTIGAGTLSYAVPILIKS